MSRANGAGAVFKNISATTASFNLQGGRYAAVVVATWGGGNVALNVLAADGVTWVPVVTAWTANAFNGGLALPAGLYQVAVTTATAVYLSLTGLPVE
jgi:hypothetical protein